jgi:hemerythrin superfamily protein
MGRRRGRGRGSSFTKWGLISGAIAGGAALIPLVPAIRRRAMRITTILKKDHRMVSGLITTLQMTPRINGMVRTVLLNQIHNQVMLHAQSEEEVLYPAMRNLMGMVAQSKVDEAYREHQEIKDLLNDLTTMDPVSDAFDAKFAGLRGRIEQHVKEEERLMFEMLKQRLPTDQQEELGRRVHERKRDLKRRMAA